MDVYGVVNNVSYIRYLEQARVEFLGAMEETGRDAFFDGGSVVVSHSIEYRSQVKFSAKPLTVSLWVDRLTSATVSVGYEVRYENSVCAVASTMMAPFDYVKARPRRIRDGELRFFRRHLSAGAVDLS